MTPAPMPPEPAAILGFLFGVLLTLFIQAYGRRKARRAETEGATQAAAQAEHSLRLLAADNERQSGQVLRLEERIATLERIAVDPAERTHRAIEALR